MSATNDVNVYLPLLSQYQKRLDARAGTLASTRALFGFIEVFPQSSIRYGPRGFGDSPSVLPGDIRSVSAAPVAVAKTVRRMVTSSVADMVHLLYLRTRCITRRCRVTFLKPTDASARVTNMFDRVPSVDYVEGKSV